MIRKAILFFLLISQLTHGQDVFRYEKDFLTPAFFKERRAEVIKQMPDSSVAFLFAAPERIRANDTYFPYHQNPNFYYLTGFTEPNCMLMLFNPGIMIDGKNTTEALFIQLPVKEREVWTGKIPLFRDATAISGIEIVTTINQFDLLNLKAEDFKMVLYTSMPSGVVDDKSDTTDLFDIIDIFKKKLSYPPPNGDSFKLNKMIAAMREIKQPEEIKLMRKAINISCDGHLEMMKNLKPGMTEYQVQATGEYVFKYSGAEYLGYNSICGSAENSCILHYETNRRTLDKGDLILLDMGAEYHGYSADVTRTLPVNGTFSNEQRIIYQLVKRSQDSAFAACKPGNAFRQPHNAAVEVIKNGLKELEIISDQDDYSKYFMHGTSHYLGLDVHDAGTRGNLKEGSVITVEPGIYIPVNSPCDPKWWNIGVRIEDDVLITKNGHENLSAGCPSSIEEIEKIMAKPQNR